MGKRSAERWVTRNEGDAAVLQQEQKVLASFKIDLKEAATSDVVTRASRYHSLVVPPEWTFLGWPMSVWAVVVAAVGAVASTAVAVAAFRASSRANQIAIQNRVDSIDDGRRHERREFYEVGMTWLAAERANLVSLGVGSYPHVLGRLSHLIDSTTAPKLTKWLWEGAMTVAAEGPSASPERTAAYDALVQAFGDSCALWVQDAKKNYQWAPFAVPAAAATP